MAKWVCNVCGYVYEGDAAPEACPICKAPASKFTKQDGEMTWAAEHVVGIAQGVSTVTESIWENRFKYVDELARMGAQIQIEGSVAIITGVDHYTGARVQAPDLRAGAALVIAGLAGDGITVVDDIYFIQRGYESFAEKLQGLGGQIEQTSSEREIQKFVLKVS